MYTHYYPTYIKIQRRNIVTSLYFIIQALGTVLNAGIALIPMSVLTAFFVYVGLMTLATISSSFSIEKRNSAAMKNQRSLQKTS